MSQFKIGDFVTTKKYGHKGRITDIHGKCPESKSWVNGQEIPLTKDELSEIWYSILCHNPSGGGGSVVVPESDVIKIEQFDFINLWASDYFKD